MTHHGKPILHLGSPDSGSPPTSDWQALLQDASVVSFDVFDTLLLRRHFVPTDVFMETGTGTVARPYFRLIRIATERLTRLHYCTREDITLAQIYRWLPADARIELDAETKSLHANPAARLLYQEALALGKRMIAISDMYLPQEFIAGLLRNNGFDAIGEVFVSSETGLTKGSGTMYAHVSQMTGVPPARILHVGDNPASDVKRALDSGYQVLPLPAPGSTFAAAQPRFVNRLQRPHSLSSSLLLGLMRDAHVRRGWDDYWYDFGFRIAGPVVSEFTRWVSERAKALGASHTYFLARDGSLPMKMLQAQGDPLPATYTHASRRLFLVPALETLDDTLLETLCSSLPGTSALEYWHRLGIDNPEAQHLFERHFPDQDRIVSSADRRRLANAFRALHPLILPDIRREREVLRGYLDSIGLLDPNQIPLIVDVGWRASSQRLLERAIPELRGTPGAYFGLSNGAYRNGAMEAYFFSEDRPQRHASLVMHCVEIVEALFSASHPTVQRLGIAAAGGYEPIYAAQTDSSRTHQDIVHRVHEGALDFVRDLRTLEAEGYSLRLNRDDIAGLLTSVILHPDSRDVAHMGRLPHALGLGSSRYETLLPAPLPKFPLEILSTHLGRQRQRLYWPRGLVRAVSDRHGAVQGFGARCAVTIHALALRAHGLLMSRR